MISQKANVVNSVGPDGAFIVPKRDMLPLYEFQHRMAIPKRENAFADLPKLKEKGGCNVRIDCAKQLMSKLANIYIIYGASGESVSKVVELRFSILVCQSF